mmetsp:Transcript_28066/g.41456  ORF Transcript_28066/g.41456 Transcript_28066/m.41456 type:complete len:1167 (+) Transcript_28066:53-3553(+)|eukprot:CAMPEP_0194234376 /NCGR_PEP_ID=MMETSP0158-20130606/2103_1 /TAXON_ID=33649 /ORGANISM="Thalassionema nitzschioides, Strain L26-B" /LENGTH=1166 /DNA_ID=CAMNT_0038967525 /DNA_START=20 /DNA_END=3520 /DNA_ORIENTATION=-
MSSRKRRASKDSSPDYEEDDAENEEESSPKRQTIEDEDGSPRRNIHESDDDGEEDLAPRVINRPGKPASVGIIQSIHVENFMCHRKLTVKLNQNVNFISGQNGSGKSAILAAIQICLGAGARRTHRAKQLGELVRKESSSGTARIQVTLRNEGSDGFHPDLYGSSITIERTLSRSGSGTYKLKNGETGKTISTCRKDLTSLLDQLNIQVENPVAVLDQEEAKKFLTGKASDKYSFFTKATDLERLDRTYANVFDSIQELHSNKDRVENSLTSVVDTVKRLKAEVEQFTLLEEWEDKVSDIRRRQGWSVLQELHNENEESKERLMLAEEKLAQRQKVYDELCAGASGDEEMEAMQEKLQALNKESAEASQLKRDAEHALKQTSAPIRMVERESKQIQKEMTIAQRKLDEAQRTLRQEQQKLAEGFEAKEQAQRLSDLEEQKKKLAEIKEAAKHWQQEQSEHLRTYQELEPVVTQAKDRSQNLSRQVYAVEQKLKELQASKGNQVAVFGGPKAAKLATSVQRMKQAGRWKGPVIGPIGMYVKIAAGKEEFAALAGHALGNLLDRFIVTNDHDRQLFQKLRQEARCSRECNCFQTKESPRYQIRTCGVNGVESVATCLSVDNDLVFNLLVDQARIDSHALMRSKEHAEEVLLQELSPGRESIRGGNLIKKIYTLPRGDVMTLNRQGGRNMQSNERPLKQIIGADTRAALREAQAELEHLQNELKENKSQESGTTREFKVAKQKWNSARSKVQQHHKKVEEIEETMNALQVDIDAANNIEETDFTELEEDIENANQDITALQEKFEAAEKSKEDLQPDIEQAKSRVNELAARNERVIADIEKVEEQLTQFMAQCGERERKKDRAKQKVLAIEERMPQFQALLDERTHEYQKGLRQSRLLQWRFDYNVRLKQMEKDGEAPDLTAEDPAEEILDEIEIQNQPKNPAYYEAKVNKLRERIEQEKDRRNLKNITYEEAIDKYNRARKDLKAKNAQIETIKENLDSLDQDLASRTRRWKRFRKHYIHMTKNTFDEILNLKGSSGTLEFDHNERTLDLVVQKDNTDEGSQNKDVKALSGGERSFTTLALLVAMGERLETPFRVMDEFDVFLDPVSRKIALETLVEIAKKMDHRQFIFITPQDLSSIVPGEKVKIFKMTPPARGNKVGGLSQQVLDQ